MNHASHQLKIQRHRFAHHALETLSAYLPSGLRSSAHGVPASTRSEQAAREAQEVRAMAYAYSQTDPGFSSDLYAAAARHEGLFQD